MLRIRRIRLELKRAALLGALIAALAHVPPLYLAQRIDGALLDAYADAVARPEADIVVLNLSRVDAIPVLATGTRATIIGPTLLALGPVETALWADLAPWILAAAALASMLVVRDHRRPYALGLALGGPAVLIGLSGGAFAGAGLWFPVAGPALLLVATGSFALAPAGLRITPTNGAATEATAARELLEQDMPEAAWLGYRDVPTTPETLPELYELGDQLAAAGYNHLAADAYHRVAQVDSDYRSVAARLARAARPDAFDNPAMRSALRRSMPDRVGRYELLEPIGQGTMGSVFLARDPRISRLVAIKLIDLTLDKDDPDFTDTRERFLLEAETTGRLTHPNIVTVYDVGESDRQAYIAMEFLKGELLSNFTRPGTLLPAEIVLELGALAAEALDYAHRQNVIHRDIKPANIMYDSISGDLKITDFGIARLIDVNRTRTGVVLGTPSFMAPEQIEGGNVKGHTDLFALGVSLYELLTGQLPFRGNSMTKLMFVIANEPHEPVSALRPDLPVEIDAVMDMALCKDPSGRFRRGAAMADALRAVAGRIA